MFEFTSLGLLLAAAGLLYMFLIGIRLIPERRGGADLTEAFGMARYLTDVILLPEAKSVGTIAANSPLVRDLEVEILAVFRDGERLQSRPEQIVLQARDVVRLSCDTSRIQKLQSRLGVSLISHLGWRDQDIEGDQLDLIEAVVSPRSPLIGHTLKGLQFKETFGAKVLAIRHHGQVAQTKLDSTALSRGGYAPSIRAERPDPSAGSSSGLRPYHPEDDAQNPGGQDPYGRRDPDLCRRGQRMERGTNRRGCAGRLRRHGAHGLPEARGSLSGCGLESDPYVRWTTASGRGAGDHGIRSAVVQLCGLCLRPARTMGAAIGLVFLHLRLD